MIWSVFLSSLECVEFSVQFWLHFVGAVFWGIAKIKSVLSILHYTAAILTWLVFACFDQNFFVCGSLLDSL
jgi:hypothetical protein